MKSIRRILFAQCAMTIAMSFAHASITKVGNGDDGADLEALTPIKSGPIWEARQRAVETLTRLNVVGVPGLGLLIPELERTDLLMASQNAHPIGERPGSLEVSDDKKFVYARTFAEPYAATRFFPAAQSLTVDQLVALQIHEALHRALPADIRGNEDIVMHLTMAMTSPGASFDRVLQVASLYTKPVIDTHEPTGEVARSTSRQKLVLPEKSRTKFGYEFDSYSDQKFGTTGYEHLHGLEVNTGITGFKAVGPFVVEPDFRARVKISDQAGTSSFVGPSSYDLLARVQVEEQTFAGPFFRFTAKSLDDAVFVPNDRDLITFGAFYRTASDDTYLDSAISYSLPSNAENQGIERDFKAILSLSGHAGFKVGHFRLGGIAELHASDGVTSTLNGSIDNWGDYTNGNYGGASTTTDPFRILVAGPEMGYVSNRFQVTAFCKWIVNDTPASLDDLGDVVDRGAGRGGFGTTFTMAF